jgi:hypothetical protein
MTHTNTSQYTCATHRYTCLAHLHLDITSVIVVAKEPLPFVANTTVPPSNALNVPIAMTSSWNSVQENTTNITCL